MEISPILLVGGIAASIGGVLPIVALTEGANLVASLASTGFSPTLDNFFAHYRVMPGGSLLRFRAATTSFANQAVAANAIISDANTVSLEMTCPAGANSGGYPLKLLTIMALQQSLKQHSLSGGTYTVITPSAIYANSLLLQMVDIDSQEGTQVQQRWQLDFYQPLVTIQQAVAAQNSAMQAITNGTPANSTLAPSIFGSAAGALTVGNPFSLLGTQLTPATVQ